MCMSELAKSQGSWAPGGVAMSREFTEGHPDQESWAAHDSTRHGVK